MWDDGYLPAMSEPEDAPDPTPPRKECIWRQSERYDGGWDTDCGYDFILDTEDSPSDLSMAYCTFCGLKLKEEVTNGA